MISTSLPPDTVVDHLIELPYCLKNLGAVNDDGWGLAYYNDSIPQILRGSLPANIDPAFDSATQELAASDSRIGVGHVRIATSGGTSVPDPHPFVRSKGEKWWAFGHNGGLSKTVLKNLIGEDYLGANPPTIGADWNDSDVVDSDLYMLYILKCIEQRDWNVTEGISQAVTDIIQLDNGALNFFLTDGHTLWGFKKGYTLYYFHNSTNPQYSVIASQPPSNTQEGWTALNDYNLITLTSTDPPALVENVTTIPELPPSYVLIFFMVSILSAAVINRKRQFSQLTAN